MSSAGAEPDEGPPTTAIRFAGPGNLYHLADPTPMSERTLCGLTTWGKRFTPRSTALLPESARRCSACSVGWLAAWRFPQGWAGA